MSLNLTFKCDALNCHTSQEYWDVNPEKAENIPKGWHEHDGFHYCPACWETVKLEISNDEEE